MDRVRELKDEANKYFNKAAKMDSGDFGHDSNLQKVLQRTRYLAALSRLPLCRPACCTESAWSTC